MYRFLSFIIDIFEFDMRKIINIFLLLFSVVSFSQTDYSDNWQDFFSYNNVKDFVIVDDVIFALCDNAVFTYDIPNETLDKLSSINGLSGEQTSAIHYSESTQRLVIGYDSGLLEIIDAKGNITVAPDIVNFNQIGLKSINNIYEYNNKLYLATAFAVIVYDIENLEFGDTYFIGFGSTDVFVNDIVVFNDEIYAATDNGVYIADVNSNALIDASNWNQQFTGVYKNIEVFNDDVYVTLNNTLQRLNNTLSNQVLSFSESVLGLKSSNDNLVVSLSSSARIYDENLVLLGLNETTTDFSFTLNTATFYDDLVYLATDEYGILSTSISGIEYQEIHPEGPSSNNVFSIDVHNNDVWIVYGGYNNTFTPVGNTSQGYSHYNGEFWTNVPVDPNNRMKDLSRITIDENAENRVFISSFGGTFNENSYATGGLFEIEDNEIKNFYNHLNSDIERIIIPGVDPNFINIRIAATAFDNDGNLWVSNVEVDERLKMLSSSGDWSSYNISDLIIPNTPAGITEIAIDRINTKWLSTRGNGIAVFNENGNRRLSLTTEINKGSLPNNEVKTIAIDNNNDVWIGTISGLVVYYNAEGVFNQENYNAEPIIIEENGLGERLLGDQRILSIAVDGANNKWFGMDGGGVLNTNSTGRTTLASFNTENSPLPSNTILKIDIDDSTGIVYFATDKGIVAYDSSVAPFGDELGEVYAYPNPALKNHNTVTIAGRNGSSLPEGTNVKILDVAGNLVYESNVVEGQELQGGKVVWNKRNLAGNKVASGIYIALLATDDGMESQTTKIAIVN